MDHLRRWIFHEPVWTAVVDLNGEDGAKRNLDVVFYHIDEVGGRSALPPSLVLIHSVQ